jgi:hypothetical protein
MTQVTRRATIFILSDVRSGSTLLDQCLGGHPEIASLGEVHWLVAYWLQDRSLYDPEHPLVCSCGLPIRTCPFWSGVESALGRPLGSLELTQRIRRSGSEGTVAKSIRHVPRRMIKTRPRVYRYWAVRAIFGGPRAGRESIALYDAVTAASGKPFCVDSSKSPYRFRDVHALDPGRSLAIVLTRDCRAVVHSKVKRGQPLEAAALQWRRRMEQIDALTCDLPRRVVHTMTYEDFCERPEDELSRLCGFLGVDYAASMLERAGADLHHIGGSPSKFDGSRTRIALDRSYVDRFTPGELARIREIVGAPADRSA